MPAAKKNEVLSRNAENMAVTKEKADKQVAAQRETGTYRVPLTQAPEDPSVKAQAGPARRSHLVTWSGKRTRRGKTT